MVDFESEQIDMCVHVYIRSELWEKGCLCVYA